MIKIKRFQAKNFLSFDKLEYELPDSGLTYVGGVNGSGKSSMWEIIPFCLYGKTVRGGVGADVIRWGQKSVSVEIEFSIGENNYRIKRSRMVRGQELEFFRVTSQTNVVLTGIDIRDTQRIIEEEIGMSYPLFINSVIFGQGLSYRFTQAPDSEKKEIFDQLMALEWLKESQTKAKLNLSGYRLMKEELTRERAEKLLLIQSLREEISRWDEAIGLEEAEMAVKDVKKLIEIYSESVETYNEESRLSSEEVKDRNVESDTMFGIIQVCKKLKEEMEKEFSHWDRRVREVGEKIKGVTDLEEVECPSCFQIVPKEHVETVATEFSSQLAVYKGGREKVSSEIDVLSDQMKVLNDKLSAMNVEIMEWEEEKVRAGYKISDERSKLSAAKEKYAGCMKELERAVEEAEKIQSLKERGERKQKEADGLDERLVTVQRDLNIAEFWVDGFGNKGVKSLLLDSVVEWMNSAALHFANKLSRGSLIPVFSSTSLLRTGEERETFSVNVKKGEKIVEYKMISGGEKRRVDVIVLLTLYRLLSLRAGKEVNLLVFDEVMESLDAEGMEQVVNVLAEFKEKGKCIYVISHQEEVKSLFDTEMTVVKSIDEVSRII